MQKGAPAPALFLLDGDRTVLQANDAALAVYGAGGAVVGCKCWQIFQHGKDACPRPSQFCWLQRVLDSGRPVRTVVAQTISSGREVLVSVTASLLHNGAGGKVPQVAVVMHDLAAEKRALNEERCLGRAGLFDQAPEALFTVDRHGRLTEVNATWLEVFGFDRLEVVGRLEYCLLATADSREVCGQILHALLGGEDVGCAEIEWQRADGSTFFSRVRARCLGVDLCGAVGLVSVRPLALGGEEYGRMRESIRFVKALLDSLGEGVLFIDREYRIVDVNRKYLELEGRSASQVVGQHCHAVTHDSAIPCWELDGDSHQCPVRAAFESGAPASAVHVHGTSFGRPRFIEVRAYPLRNDRGEIYQVIETHTDITQRRQLEEQVAQAQKMDALGTLAGGIAHDLNNLLTPILGNAELLLMEHGSGAAFSGELVEIQEAAERAAALVSQILAFCRRQVLAKKKVNWNETVGRLLPMFRRLIPENIQVETDLAADLWDIHADPGQLGQVLLNLLVNGRDAITEGGTLTIESHNVQMDGVTCHTCGEAMDGDYVVLVVSDTGSGMDRATMERIFEPFFTSKGEGHGTGLGLSTVLGILHQHHAHINVYSEVGMGSVFKVYFPRRREAGEEKEVDPLDGVAEESPASGRETVLVVDDDARVRLVVEKILGKSGYTVLQAADGEAALELFEAAPEAIDLLLTDVVMPNMGGKELAQHMRRRRPDLAVLFTSGYSLNAVHHLFVLEAGIEYIQKPLVPKVLLRRVRETLERGRGGGDGGNPSP